MKKLLITSSLILALAGSGSVALTHNTTPAQAVDSPLVQEVQHQKEVLNNHEGRITNTENDVKDLQANTNTPPSSTRVEVRTVTTPVPTDSLSTPEAISQPQPITVTNTGYVMDVSGGSYCELTYSDGTTDHQPPHFTYQTNPDGSTSANDHCQDYLGQTKN